MAFIPTLNCIQARLIAQTAAGAIAENIFYAATTSAPTETDMQEVGDAIGEWATESYQNIMTTDWTMTGINLRAVNEEEGLARLFTDGFPLAGEAGGAGGGHQVTYSVTWATGLIGRSARGRSYGIGLPSTYIAGGNRLSDTGRAALQSPWANLLTIMSASGHAIQVVSFVDAGVPRAAGRKLPILSCNVRFPLATQRRRLA